MAELRERRRLDPVKTRETILIAAFDTFAEIGFAGASIADIAAQAKVPKSLVQYHFGNKEELWMACLDQKARPVIEALDRVLENGADPSRIAELMSVRFQLLQHDPKIARILAWASLGTAPIPDFLSQRREKMRYLSDVKESGFELANLFMVIAAMDGWFLYRNFYSRAMGVVFDDELVNRQLQLFMTLLTQGDEEGIAAK